jgi:DNA-binding CsgD family transcriptional regulator
MKVDIAPEQLSSVIGKIYDCAIDPALWPGALESMCGLIGAAHGSVSLIDYKQQTIRLATQWGLEPYWLKLLSEKYGALMPLYGVYQKMNVGEILNTQMTIDRHGDQNALQSPFFTEWAIPAGLRDVAAACIMRTDRALGMFCMMTPTTADLVGPKELAVSELLTPHVRRAVMISDLLDMRSMATAAFEETINTLSAAVVLVDAKCNILHANSAARAMFAAGGPILSQQGVLGTHDANSVTALKDAIGRAAADESGLGYGGIGVPVRNRNRSDILPLPPSIAHVLPLKSGTLRPGLALGAAAAVFVTPALENSPPPSEALAALYDLTPTEARVMIEIASGKNRAATAIALGIADSTVKTHLARVFAKTGTSTQPELAKLVASLTPPIVAQGKA